MIRTLEMESNENLEGTYTSFDENEENLYIEFQNIVLDLSKEITNNVMESIIATPLDEIYQKYESQIPRIKSSTKEIFKVSKQIQETKNELYDSIAEIISEVSHKTIEDTVFTKLELLKKAYEKQLPLVEENSKELQLLIQEVNDVTDNLHINTQLIISDISSQVIHDNILVKFDELYEQNEIQLPQIKETSNNIERLLVEIENTRNKLHSNIGNVYQVMSNKIIDTVNEKLNDVYEKYNRRVVDLDQIHEQLLDVSDDLYKTRKEFLQTSEQYNVERDRTEKAMKALQEETHSLNSKVDLQNKILIGAGIVVALSLFI